MIDGKKLFDAHRQGNVVRTHSGYSDPTSQVGFNSAQSIVLAINYVYYSQLIVLNVVL